MSLGITLQVGAPAKVAPGANNAILSADAQSNLLVSEYHGRYFNAAYNNGAPGNMYSLANQAAVTTTAGLATTFTGLALANPAGSGVNLEILFFTAAQLAVGVAGAVGFMTGLGAAAGSLIPRAAITGQTTASKANGSNSATLGGTPVLEEAIGSIGSLATTGYGLQSGLIKDVGGSLIIPPGAFIASYTSAACTSAFIFGFRWLEVPI